MKESLEGQNMPLPKKRLMAIPSGGSIAHRAMNELQVQPYL